MAEALTVLKDVKSVILGVTKPAVSLRTMFNIDTPPLERSIGRVIRSHLVANAALRKVQLVAQRLRKLPVKYKSEPTPNVKLSDVKNLKDLLPLIGFENLDVGSKKVDILYAAASTQDKLEFYLSIVRHLIKVGEAGPRIEVISTEAQSEDEEDSDDEEEEEGAKAKVPLEEDPLLSPLSPIKLKSAVSAPSDPLRTRAFAKVIVNVEKMRLKIVKVPELMDEDAAERNKEKFTSQQIEAMKELDTEFYVAMKSYMAPFFKEYTMEEFRLALKVRFRTKDVELFKVTAFNFYYPEMIQTPVRRRMIAHDYTFCIAWLGMWRRMKDETIENFEMQEEEYRRKAIAELKTDDEVQKELPDDLKTLRAESAESRAREPEENLDADCMICLRTIPPHKQVVTDSCHHLFCRKCTRSYMEHRKFVEFATCPCCTKKIKCWMYRDDYKYAKQKLTSSGALKKKIPNEYFDQMEEPMIYADSKLLQYVADLEEELAAEEEEEEEEEV